MIKRKNGLTFGGLEQKMFNFSLALILVVALCFTGVSVWQLRAITGVLSRTVDKQKESITATSTRTMDVVVKQSISNTVQLEAFAVNKVVEAAHRDGSEPSFEDMPDIGAIASSGYVFAIDSSGKIVYSNAAFGPFAVSDNDIRNMGGSDLAGFAEKAISGETITGSVTEGDKTYYIACSPIPALECSLVVAIDHDVAHSPTRQLIADYDTQSAEAQAELTKSIGESRRLILVLMTIIVLFTIQLSISGGRRIVKPLNKMVDRITNFKTGDIQFRMEDTYRTGDEIEELAQAFADISEKTMNYVKKITTITAEKERIGAELGVATQIQEDMLPNIFPPYPERSEFDIYATMNPAKEVGGDFYDFYMIDHDHVALTIADVSGKGVPAALFMVISKTLMQNHALMGGSPKEILEYVNHQLCQHNKADMFVTVWLAIVELSTGKVTAANAGHEFPAIRRSGSKFELMKDKHGFVVGGMDGMQYKEYTFELKKGDSLYVYTDGVPEATDANCQLFGTDRMIHSLNKHMKDPPQDLLKNIRSDIDEFVGDAPQFDDITMLVFNYYGTDNEKKNMVMEKTVDAVVESINAVTEFVDEILSEKAVPLKIITKINIVIDEILGNIAHYAYEDGTVGKAKVTVEMPGDYSAVTLRFEDSGKPYDPLSAADPELGLSADDMEIGGLGIFITKKFMDDLKYEYKDGRNILSLTKKLV